MLKSHRQFNGTLRAKGRLFSEGLMVVFYAQAFEGRGVRLAEGIAAVIGY